MINSINIKTYKNFSVKIIESLDEIVPVRVTTVDVFFRALFSFIIDKAEEKK